MTKLSILFTIIFSVTAFAENPFLINFEAKKNVTNEDYIEIQNQLRKIQIRSKLDPHITKKEDNILQNNCWWRYTVGIRQTLIKPQEGLFPVQELVKIGQGGDRCIVSLASYDSSYYQSIQTTTSALEECGFNGYFYYRIGGFPNPTGREIQYVGVPYCFKIFMMLEAEQLGFNKLLWIDSSALPLKDPSPLFNHIEQKGAFINGWSIDPSNESTILSIARESIGETLGINYHEAFYISTGVFGFDFNLNQTHDLINEYYHLVDKGLPFVSCFPEEYVLMALINQPKNANWNPIAHDKVFTGPFKDESPEKIQQARSDNFYFYIRKH